MICWSGPSKGFVRIWISLWVQSFLSLSPLTWPRKTWTMSSLRSRSASLSPLWSFACLDGDVKAGDPKGRKELTMRAMGRKEALLFTLLFCVASWVGEAFTDEEESNSCRTFYWIIIIYLLLWMSTINKFKFVPPFFCHWLSLVLSSLGFFGGKKERLQSRGGCKWYSPIPATHSIYGDSFPLKGLTRPCIVPWELCRRWFGWLNLYYYDKKGFARHYCGECVAHKGVGGKE